MLKTVSIMTAPNQAATTTTLFDSHNLQQSTTNSDISPHHSDDHSHDDYSDKTNSKRPLEELIRLVKLEDFDPTSLSNDEIIGLMMSRQVSVHKLESILGKSNAERCVGIRRQYYIRELELLDTLEHDQHHHHHHHHSNTVTATTTTTNNKAIENSSRASVFKQPLTTQFDYERVVGACCENVVGCVRLPVGIAGPLLLDGNTYYVPMATTEGCLVASTSRGFSALQKSGGIISRVRKDCMTRAPIVRFQDSELRDAIENVDKAINWLQDPLNKEKIKTVFRSTSKHTKLIDYTLHPIGRELHIRFEAETGDAMGMNMCSKGAELALKEMQRVFTTMDILTLSGNMCTDKKPSAMNWTCGRGKSVECSSLLSADVVERVFKVPVDSLIEVWQKKVMVGSALAGSIGGFNCHAANIVSAIFIATGQDAAQVVSSSNCLMTFEKDSRGHLAVHCSMPSIECGTVGGGTVLRDQGNYLQLMGIRGSSDEFAIAEGGDSNARKLARIICATVMAAELSLLASLTEGTLVKSHMAHNRSSQPCKVV